MKRIFIALTAAALTLALCACGNNSDSKGTSSTAPASSTASAESKTDDSQESKDASSSSALQTALEKVKTEVKMPGDTSDYTAKRIMRTFGISEDQMSDFAGMYCNDGVTQDQIIYIKAKAEGDVPTIQEKLKANLDSIYNVIKNYTPEQAAMIEKATVDTDGLYVSLVISDNADAIKKIFSESIKG